MKRTKAAAAAKPRFHNVSGPMCGSDDALGKVRPVDALPVYTRVGMCVTVCNGIDGAGLIINVTAHYCIARFPGGKVEALTWHEVELDHVQPDPAFLPPPAAFRQQQHAEKPKRRRRAA